MQQQRLFELSDLLLQFAIKKTGFMYVEIWPEFKTSGYTDTEIDIALAFMRSGADATIIRKPNNEYIITDYAHSLHSVGGYLKRYENYIQDHLDLQKKKEWEKKINQSLLDTNESVQELNAVTKVNYRIQVANIIATLIIISGTLVMSILTYLDGADDKSQYKHIQKTIQQQQQQIDSVLYILNKEFQDPDEDSVATTKPNQSSSD